MAAADPPHFEWGVSPAEGVDVETDTGARLVCSWGKPRRRYVWARLHSCQPVEKSPCAVGAMFKMHLCEGDMAACPVRKYPPSKWNTEPPACHGVANLADRLEIQVRDFKSPSWNLPFCHGKTTELP